MSNAEQDREEEVITILRRRLYEREKQVALLGISADPSINLEIEDLKREIAIRQQSLTHKKDTQANSDTNQGEAFDRVTSNNIEKNPSVPSININVFELIEEYQKRVPVLGVDSVLSEIIFSDWRSTSLGLIQSASKPTTEKDINVTSFGAAYIGDILLIAQIRETYTLDIYFDPGDFLGIQLLSYSLEQITKPTTVYFFEYSDNATLINPRLENAVCTVCKNNSSDCEVCRGRGLPRIKLYCVSNYPEIYTLLPVQSTIYDGEIKRPDKFDTVYVSDVFQQGGGQSFNFFGLTKQGGETLMANYSHSIDRIKHKIETKILSRVSKYVSPIKPRIIHDEIISPSVTCNGMKFLFRLTPSYQIAYGRQVDYTAGVWNKKQQTAQITGNIWSAGSQKLEKIEQSEKVTRK